MKSSLLTLDPKRIKPFADQPRKRFRGIQRLAESIRLIGQKTPIVVTGWEGKGFDYELVDGERRLQACLFGQMPIKAVLHEGELTDAERFEAAVAANFCRQQHDCIEISDAIMTMRDAGRSAAHIGTVFGRTEAWVYQHAALAALHPEVRKMLESPDERQSHRGRNSFGKMSFQLALLLAPLDPAVQVNAARRIADKQMNRQQAGNYIKSLRVIAGKHVASHEPKRKFTHLWTMCDRFRRVIDEWADLQPKRLTEIFAAANAREASTMAEQMGDMAATLRLLASELKKAGAK